MRFRKRHFSKAAERAGNAITFANNLETLTVFILAIGIAIAAAKYFIPAFRDFTHTLSRPTIFALGISGLTMLAAISIWQIVIFRRIQKEWAVLERHAVYDRNTGIFTRSFFEEMLEEETRRVGRYRYPLSLCLLDIDDFKSYNQSYGRSHGDALVERFSKFLHSQVRTTDGVSRHASDEFLILLPHTDLVNAEKFIYRLLVQTEERMDISFCAGVVNFRAGESPADFLSRSQLALDQAKREGKKSIRCLVGGEDQKTVVSF